MNGITEECPHCEQSQPWGAMDLHLATIHDDIPPCTARLNIRSLEYECVLRAGHKSAYGTLEYWHASERGPIGGRQVWSDSADGATPHKEPTP